MTIKRHGWLTSTLRLVPVIAVAAAAMIAMAPTEARAQAASVHEFACAATGLAVDIDIRGLGTLDVCVIATITEEVDCACVGGGNNCPSDAKKQTTPTTITSATTLHSENGRVDTTFTPTITTPTSCTGPVCGSGQTAKVIQFTSSGVFRVCPLEPGTTCDATTCTTANDIATAGTEADPCGPTSPTVVNAGKKDSCLSLFQ